MQPLLRWRMARADSLAWAGVARVGREERALVKRVLKLVREQGPIRAERGRRAEAHPPGG